MIMNVFIPYRHEWEWGVAEIIGDHVCWIADRLSYPYPGIEYHGALPTRELTPGQWESAPKVGADADPLITPDGTYYPPGRGQFSLPDGRIVRSEGYGQWKLIA